MKIDQTLTSRIRQLEAYIMKQFLNITQRKFIEWLIILSIFIVSIPNKWTLMISIALSLLLLKRGALGVVQLIILYMLRSQIYTPYDLSLIHI